MAKEVIYLDISDGTENSVRYRDTCIIGLDEFSDSGTVDYGLYRFPPITDRVSLPFETSG